jgi:hypothetical protein
MLPNYFIRGAVFASALICGTAIAGSPTVTFDIKFSGHVDCESPLSLENVPLSVKATSVLNSDGTGSMQSVLTAYYFLTAKSNTTGKLGGPPTPIEGGTATIKVLNQTGLSYTQNHSETQYTVNIVVDGKKCGAQLIPKLKGNNKSYQIFTMDAEFRCSRFEVEKSSCRVR